MLFKFNKINKVESKLITVLKLFLLLEVIMGHSIALSLPKANTLDYNNFLDFSILFYKFFFSFGAISAYVFVFLSGYLTSRIFLNLNNFVFIEQFKRRILRIYPIFLISILLTIIIDIIGMNVFQYSIYTQNGMNYFVPDHYSLQILFLNSLSLQPTFTDTIGSNGPLWTLGYLVQFFILGLIIKNFVKNSSQFYIISFIISFIIGLVISIEFFMLFMLWLFGIYFRSLNNINLKINIKLISFSILFLIVLLLISKLNTFSYSVILISFPISILTVFFMKYCSLKFFNRSKFKRFNIRDYSYQLYVFHMPMLFFIIGLKNTFLQNKLGFFSHFLSTIMVLIFCITLSKIIEKTRII